MLSAVDVSHHQTPSAVDWSGIREAGCDIAIVRLTYGTMIDRKSVEHVRLARASGFAVGAYLFFRPTLPVEAQRVAFAEAAALAGYGEPGDVIPALDIEDDTAARPIVPEHAALFQEMAFALQAAYGLRPYAYITQRDWGRIGRPAWVLDHPLWVAHYAAPSRREPATPDGAPWAGWQHRVGRFDLDGPNGYYEEHPQIDQNRFRALYFLNGDVYRSDEPEDAALRVLPDDEGTEDIRRERLEQELRVFATGVATDAHFANLDALRRDAFTEPDAVDTSDEPTDPGGNNA